MSDQRSMDGCEESIWERVQSEVKQGQLLSWDTTYSTSYAPVPTAYITEQPISTYETLFKFHFYNGYSFDGCEAVLSRECLMKDIYSLILGLSSKTFVYNEEKREFTARMEQIRIDGCSAKSMNIALTRFLAFGTHLNRLDNVASKCEKHPRLYGLVGLAFGRSLSACLLHVRSAIVALMEQSGGIENIDLMELYHILDESSLVLEKLAVFCHCDISNSALLCLPKENLFQHSAEGFYLPFGSFLLSSLYSLISPMASNTSPFLKTIFLSLFAQCYHPYLQMVNEWIGLDSENKLALIWGSGKEKYDDEWGEFFIERGDEENGKEGNEWMNAKISKKNPPPTFISAEVARDILEAGKALRLLHDCCPNHHLFQSTRASDLLDKIIPPSPSSILSTSFTNLSGTLPVTKTSTLTLLEHLLSTYSSPSSSPITTARESVLSHALLTQCRLVNMSILSFFFRDLSLRSHLKVLREYLLMGNATFMNDLSDALFADNVDSGIDIGVATSRKRAGVGLGMGMNSRRTWPPVGAELRMALKAVIVENVMKGAGWGGEEIARGDVMGLDNMLMFGIKNDEEWEVCKDPNALEALDFLYLDYRPPYPINVLITPDHLVKYNQIFTLLLRILRLGSVVCHIYRSSHTRSMYTTTHITTQKFRFESHQFIIALQCYVFDVAIDSTWSLFMKKLDNKVNELEIDGTNSEMEIENDGWDDGDDGCNVKDLDTLKIYHEKMLDRMVFLCLLKPKQEPIMKVINAILVVILAFARLLNVRRYNEEGFDETDQQVEMLYEKFRLYTAMLVKILVALDEKGGGRVNKTGLPSNKRSESYTPGEGFLQALLLRVDFNGYYKEIVERELAEKRNK